MLVVTLTAIGPVTAAPQPAGPQPAGVPQSWELRFAYLSPQRISVTLPGEAVGRTYWYVLYSVTNENRDTPEVQFLPTFTLMTDTMQVYPAEIGVHPSVYDAIKHRHRKTHPFLTEPVRTIGRLLLGEDNTRDSVAIWPDFDRQASSFTIYVGGLSGETQRIRNHRHDPTQPEVATETTEDGVTLEKLVNPKYFTLRKTLVLDYELPGNADTRGRAQAKLSRPHHWTMR
jgi:hypothetical protein